MPRPRTEFGGYGGVPVGADRDPAQSPLFFVSSASCAEFSRGPSSTPIQRWIEEGRNPTRAGQVFARPLNTAYVDANGNVVSVTVSGGSDPAG